VWAEFDTGAPFLLLVAPPPLCNRSCNSTSTVCHSKTHHCYRSCGTSTASWDSRRGGRQRIEKPLVETGPLCIISRSIQQEAPAPEHANTSRCIQRLQILSKHQIHATRASSSGAYRNIYLSARPAFLTAFSTSALFFRFRGACFGAGSSESVTAGPVGG
jgi:hypothetical protein